MPSILIIDDEASLVRSLIFALEDEGYTAYGAGNGAEGMRAAAEHSPDLILLDLQLPDRTGLEVLADLQAQQPAVPVIMISAHGDTRAAVKAVKLGAADYLTKPFELDDLSLTIRATLERRQMAQELDFHRQEAVRHSGLVGGSPAMRELAATIDRVAASAAARILILGESGTGKALVAKAIHAASLRAKGPFIEVNCASLPEQLIEAELFGAEKGAYTGAHQRRVGLVALADQGTLFLDEIGEMPLALQAKLLHFLENGHYRAIGSSRAQLADVRVVAATNRDLAGEVAAGRFREDLFYRLNVIHLAIPALRERGEDIVGLARHFAAQFAAEERSAPIVLGAAAGALLLRYRWPGNVRELKNLIERLTILYPGRDIGARELPPEIVAAGGAGPSAGAAGISPGSGPGAAAPAFITAAVAPAAPAGTPVPPATAGGAAAAGSSGESVAWPGEAAASLDATLADAERDLLLAALREVGGHKGRAADRLGISRHALKRRLQRLGIA